MWPVHYARSWLLCRLIWARGLKALELQSGQFKLSITLQVSTIEEHLRGSKHIYAAVIVNCYRVEYHMSCIHNIGPLNMVTENKRSSSTITWMPPFSLDLTGVDPDIIYCVEVYNITCGVDDLVVGNCGVTLPRFVNNRLQQGYIYRITITPRSNGQDAQNGTSNTIEGILAYYVEALNHHSNCVCCACPRAIHISQQHCCYLQFCTE